MLFKDILTLTDVWRDGRIKKAPLQKKSKDVQNKNLGKLKLILSPFTVIYC